MSVLPFQYKQINTNFFHNRFVFLRHINVSLFPLKIQVLEIPSIIYDEKIQELTTVDYYVMYFQDYDWGGWVSSEHFHGLVAEKTFKDEGFTLY